MNHAPLLDLDEIEALFANIEARPDLVGFSWTVGRSPRDGRSKESICLSLRSEGTEGELLVWDSGEAELGLILKSGQVIQEHFPDLDNTQAAKSALENLLLALADGPER